MGMEGVICETNVLSLISKRLDNYYQIQTKCYSVVTVNFGTLNLRTKRSHYPSPPCVHPNANPTVMGMGAYGPFPRRKRPMVIYSALGSNKGLV
jgi:hypothetical protein